VDRSEGSREEPVIDLAPTPEGYQRIITIFQQQIEESESIIARAERFLDAVDEGAGLIYLMHSEVSFLTEAINALQEREQERIKNMRKGIRTAEIVRGGNPCGHPCYCRYPFDCKHCLNECEGGDE
jgi:hypothetical protein